MGIGKLRFDKTYLSKAVKEFEAKVIGRMDEVGKQAVQYAIEHGEYHNVTGRLRHSNEYEVTHDRLRLYNTAPYAEDVQNRGLDVLNGAALFAEEELRKR